MYNRNSMIRSLGPIGIAKLFWSDQRRDVAEGVECTALAKHKFGKVEMRSQIKYFGYRRRYLMNNKSI